MFSVLLGAAALTQKAKLRAAGPRSIWGRDRRESTVELFVCMSELAAWISLWQRSLGSVARSDAQMLFEHTALVLCALGALGTIVDLDSDSFLDTARRLAALAWAITMRDTFALVFSLVGLAYRVRFGMGVADKAVEWGLPERQLSPVPRPAERPLNVLVLSIGTRGDVQPFIHLGHEMKARGHAVTICALEKYRNLVERNGLAFKNAGIDDIEESKFWRRCRHVSEVMADSIPNFCLNFLKIGSALFDAAVSSKADVLVVTSTAQSIALSISNKIRVPTFVVKFAPDLLTRTFPAPGYEGKRALWSRLLVPEALANLSSWYSHWFRIALASVRCRLGAVENRYREEVLGLGPLEGGARLGEMGECPNLCAFSEVVVPTPRDWPGNCLVTGWWLPLKPQRRHSSCVAVVSPSSSTSSVSSSSSSASLATTTTVITQTESSDKSALVVGGADQDGDDEIPDQVLDFVGEEKDVVCVTFGSMSPTADALGLVPLVLRACETVFGPKGKVLIVGGRFKQYAREGSVMVIDEAPYHKLFSLVRLVVHHGGAGTSASTLEKCAPSLVVPVLLWTDQPLWACQLEKLGVGVHVEQHFAFCDVEQERIVLQARFVAECEAGLRRLASDSVDPKNVALRERVAKMVDAERGVEKAADAIEFVAAKARRKQNTSS